MSKRLGEIIGCKYKISSWSLNGFLDGSNIESTEDNTGEKPIVMLHINRSGLNHTTQYYGRLLHINRSGFGNTPAIMVLRGDC